MNNFSYKKYLGFYFLFIAPFALFFLLLVIFLKNAGEISPYSEIVVEQNERDALYGSALNGWSYYDYKMELAKASDPQVIALGSSRMKEYRQEAFNTPFINAGGAMNYLNEGLLFLKEYFQIRRPKVVLIGLDFWWFNDSSPQLEDPLMSHVNETKITRQKLIAPWDWLRNGKVSGADFTKVLLGKAQTNSSTLLNTIGMLALETSDGFRKDGSFYFHRIMVGDQTALLDSKFSRTLRKIEHGNERLNYGEHVSEKEWSAFEEILELCKKNGAAPIFYLPPVSHPVFEKLQEMKSQYAFVGELDQRLKNTAAEYYDFRDASSFGGQDCEFIDGMHGGEVLQDRLLLAILKKNPHSALAPFLDQKRMADLTKRFAGKTLTSDHLGNSPELREKDFLNLGCKK